GRGEPGPARPLDGRGGRPRVSAETSAERMTTASPAAASPADRSPVRRRGSGARSLVLGAAVSLLAAGLALLVSFGIIAVTGGDPHAAAQALWDGAFGGRAQVAGTLSEVIPLVLVALGWIVAFSARRVNIGF